jgi:hypothetical protein
MIWRMSPKRAGVAGSATRTVTSVAIAGLLAPRPWTCSRWRSRSDGRPARCWSRIPTAARNRRHSPTPTGWISSALPRSAARATPTTTRSLRRSGPALTASSSRGAASPPTSMRSTTRSAGSAGTTAGASTRCWAASLCSSTSCSPPPPANPSTQHELQNRTAPAAAAALGNASQGYDRPRIGRCPPPSPARQRSLGRAGRARTNRPCQIAEPPPDPTRPR